MTRGPGCLPGRIRRGGANQPGVLPAEGGGTRGHEEARGGRGGADGRGGARPRRKPAHLRTLESVCGPWNLNPVTAAARSQGWTTAGVWNAECYSYPATLDMLQLQNLEFLLGHSVLEST